MSICRFHAEEERTVRKDGQIEISFPVTPVGATPAWRYFHVRSWILSWGPDIEVLGPAELKQRVAADAQRMAKLHGKA